MRKITVLSFITLDGVMQGPGGPEEDTSNGFTLGGWSAPYDDEESGKVMQKQLEPADLLLGRKTFDIFASYWPKHAQYWPGIMEVNKYAFSNTLIGSDWDNSHFLKTVEDVEQLKNTEGRDLKTWGSSQLVQLLLKHNLIDEFWLNIHPVILGKGKKLFGDDAIPAAFKLVESHTTPTGLIMANYRKSGEVKTGTVGPQ